MRILRYFYTLIYNRWSKTTKIFFWIGLISLVVGFLSLIATIISPFLNTDTITVLPEEGLVFTSPTNFSIECNEGVQQFPIRIINTKKVPVYNAKIAFELAPNSGIPVLDLTLEVDETYANRDLAKGSFLADNFIQFAMSYNINVSKDINNLHWLYVKVIDAESSIPVWGTLDTKDCTEETVLFRSSVECYDEVPRPVTSIENYLIYPQYGC